MTPTPPFASDALRHAFDSMPSGPRHVLFRVRERVFQEVQAEPRIGPIEETLKWGQASYLPKAPRTGTTLRLGVAKSGAPAVFVHCQTVLIAGMREQFPDAFLYEGNRAAVLTVETELPDAPLSLLIRRALTYHLKGLDE